MKPLHAWWRIPAVVTLAMGAGLLVGAQPVGGTTTPLGRVVAQETAGSSDKISVWTGVYTDEQATRGQARYQRICMSCHHGELQGDRDIGSPALAGDAFMETWKGRTVESLFEKINQTMPFEEPGTLGLQESVDLVAYILRANKVPAGQEPLTAAPDRLGRLLITTAEPK